MKALLLKDFYMAKIYCRSLAIIALVFMAVSVVSKDNMFFIMYPCLVASMVPITLLSYDERSHWLQYSGALPYRKSQIVSSKYLLGAITVCAVLLLTFIVQGVTMAVRGTFDIKELVIMILVLIFSSCLMPSVSLLASFKWGVEKGRIAYYVIFGITFIGIFLIVSGFGPISGEQIQLNWAPVVLAAAGIAMYALSWKLAIAVFDKREV